VPADEVKAPAAAAAARAAGQVVAICHMGAHALGAAGPGLLSSGQLGTIIRKLQAGLTEPDPD
jgi:hypothetical protein